MRDNHDDEGLRLRFQKLQEEVDSIAPPFSVPDPAPKRFRIHVFRPVPAFAMAAAVAALAIGIGLRDTQVPLSPGYDGVLWRGPTDFLLSTPGRDLLFTLPSLDGVPDLDALTRLQSTDPQTFG